MIAPISLFLCTGPLRSRLLKLFGRGEATPCISEENDKDSASTVSTDDEDAMFEGIFTPGGDFPGRDVDDVVKYYCGDLLGNQSWEEETNDIDPKDQDTPDAWVPRHKDLVRLTGRHPFNCEAQLKHLFEKGFITPRSLHYVRNHGAAPSIKWEDHVIHIGGLVPKPIQLKMKDIVSLPSHSLPVTLVCCGNRRKEQNMIKQTKGFNWGAAGVSTGVWTGVRLADVLRLAGVNALEDYSHGMHVRFASESELGGDKLPSGVYGTSVPLEKAVSITIARIHALSFFLDSTYSFRILITSNIHYCLL